MKMQQEDKAASPLQCQWGPCQFEAAPPASRSESPATRARAFAALSRFRATKTFVLVMKVYSLLPEYTEYTGYGYTPSAILLYTPQLQPCVRAQKGATLNVGGGGFDRDSCGGLRGLEAVRSVLTSACTSSKTSVVSHLL